MDLTSTSIWSVAEGLLILQCLVCSLQSGTFECPQDGLQCRLTVRPVVPAVSRPATPLCRNTWPIVVVHKAPPRVLVVQVQAAPPSRQFGWDRLSGKARYSHLELVQGVRLILSLWLRCRAKEKSGGWREKETRWRRAGNLASRRCGRWMCAGRC